MQEFNDHIVQLLYRRLKGMSLEAWEERELDEWLARSEYNRQVLENFLDEKWMREAKKTYNDSGKDAVLKQLKQEIYTDRKPVRRIWARVTVAASILILLVAGLRYFDVIPSENPQQVAANVLNQFKVDPGGEAILTLSNGIEKHLQKEADGVLAHLGNGRQVIKQDGKLVYLSEMTQTTAGQAGSTAGPRSDQYNNVVLPDGSQVWLYRGATLTYPTEFNGPVRRVELNGEAFFDVAPAYANNNQKKPFIVKVVKDIAGDEPYEIEVLGTEFNICAIKDEPIRTTLKEGSVKVKSGTQHVLLEPGQQAELNRNDKRIVVKNDVAVDEVIAWKDNKMLFRNASFSTLMREIKRWYGHPYIISGQITKPISITIDRDESLYSFLTELERKANVHFEMKDNTIIVTP